MARFAFLTLAVAVALVGLTAADGPGTCTCDCSTPPVTGKCAAFTSTCTGTFHGTASACTDGVSTSATCSAIPVSKCSDGPTPCTAACTSAGCTATWTCASSSSSSCFPAHATVTLENGSIKTMAALQTADRVLVSNGSFSDVYMFSHRDADAVTSFVKISAEKHTLMLTPGHYLYVNGKLAAAKTVQAGDMVEDAEGKQLTVSAVAVVRSAGLYNPHTLQGDIVVNGIKASTYTDAVAPALAHAALWPVRLAYSLGQDVVGDAFAQGSELLASALPDGKEVY